MIYTLEIIPYCWFNFLFCLKIKFLPTVMVFGSLYNKELMLWAVVLEKTLESCLDCKEIKPVKEISPEYSLEAEAETPVLWPPDGEEPTHWKRPWCWDRSKAGEEGDDRGWYGWMASLTRWTWVWVGSGSWWWTGKPGVLQFMGLQRTGHDWATFQPHTFI